MNWDTMYSRYGVACTAALVQFVWQGALLGLAGYAALRGAAHPKTRYAIACVTLMLMALTPLVTIGFGVRDVAAA